MKKFELVPEKFIPCADGKLYQIRAVKSFTTSVGKHIHKGDFGGYIAREDNLSHDGKSWIDCNSFVGGQAHVLDDALVTDHACIFSTAVIKDSAVVYESARICGNAVIKDNATIGGETKVFGNAQIGGNLIVRNQSIICCNAEILNRTQFISIQNIGYEGDKATFFRTRENKIAVASNAFDGDLDLFLEFIETTYEDNSIKQIYQAAADMARLQLSLPTDTQEQQK